MIILGVFVFCIVRYKLKQGADQHGDVIAVREINGTEVGSVDVGCGEDSSDPDIEYTEVMHVEPDASRAPVMKGTDTVYSELRKSESGM
ncbi:hypothetical protein EOD39_9604 [Acipenser ruthenus]|uniref:Uncharacterized protein n=1 Tax=Acipenser ruthenus TaxID=7906 RepID=A0A444U0F5_ACIRT|nr:hypothetical protein EOD39_9604 [Acipenser ruthenus]